MSLIKTLSTKSVFGDKEKILETVMKDKEREHFLYRVFGAIDASQTGKGKHQRVDRDTKEAVDTFWTKFFGEFYAVNADKTEYESATLFLPDYVSGQFKDQLENGVTGIIFAYDIYARYSKDSITSYEFIAAPVKSTGDESKVLGMAAQFPALPNEKAPKKLAHKQ